MGIFTKKDTNTISGENKYKGWGNTKTKVFEDERQQDAVMAGAGGDLSGKDFRQYKRDVHQQKRLNRRALRRADRQGIDPSNVQMRKGEYKELNRREQDVEQYFKDVRKERLENTAEIALVVAATAGTAGALGAFAPATAVVSGGTTATATGAGTAATAGSTTATSALLSGLNTVPVAGSAATTAGTTAATTAAPEIGKQITKQAFKSGANALSNQGTQGAIQPDPRMAQLEAQMQQLQQISMRHSPYQGYQQPASTPTYQSPEFVSPPQYTASDIYDPLLGTPQGAYNDWMNSQ